MRAWPIFIIVLIATALALDHCGDDAGRPATSAPPPVSIPEGVELRWVFTVERRGADRFVIPGRSLHIVDGDGHGHRHRLSTRPTVLAARGEELIELGTLRPG